MKAQISARNIVKQYDDKLALKGVSIDVFEGEILAIVGHNGAGKTTLLNILVDLLDKTEGEIEYIFDKRKLYNHIGVQMQKTTFEGNAKVVDVCKLYKEVTQSDIDLNSLLDEFGLLGDANRFIKHLSGGNQHRLAILLTMINRPEIIFLDELTTGLDPVARRRIWDMIKMINKDKKTTVVLTSHFLEEVEFLADRIIILEQGEVKYSGGLSEAISSHLDGQKVIQFKLKDERKSFLLDKFGAIALTDSRYEIKTSNEESVLIELLTKVGIHSLTMKAPSLEDVFFKIAGYTLDKEGRIINEKA